MNKWWMAALTMLLGASLSFGAVAQDGEKKEGEKKEEGGKKKDKKKEERKEGDKKDFPKETEGERKAREKKEGARDGDGPKKEGPRDGDGPKKEGPRDGDGPKKGPKDVMSCNAAAPLIGFAKAAAARRTSTPERAGARSASMRNPVVGQVDRVSTSLTW